MIRDALISDCGKYRYRLFRMWGAANEPTILWVMLNPSTADASIDDPTIRRCIAFSKAWGYGSMFVGNAFAFRATDPSALDGLTLVEAAGPEQHIHLRDMAAKSRLTVVAWGTRGPRWVPEEIKAADSSVWCLGTTKEGYPKHPLYVKGDTTLQRFPSAKLGDA